MQKLSMKIDHFNHFDDEFYAYISALDGVESITEDEGIKNLLITYDPKKINIQRILLEVKLFLGLLKTPSLISFDKHFQGKSHDTIVVIEDACCEYCVKGVIEDLVLVDGIEKTTVTLQDDSFFQVSIHVMYDNSILNDKQVKELVQELFPDS